MEIYLYAGMLCVLFEFLIKGIGFLKFCRKHQQLQWELANIPMFSEDFFKADTLCEEDLQEIIFRLQKIFQSSITQWEEKEQNAIDFYTTWVHQIKTPISVLKMILQKEDTKMNRHLLLEVFRIEQYVEMVLSYLRLDSTSSDFILKEYNLDKIIKEVIHKYAPQFIEKKITLVYEPNDIKIVTDEKWLSFMIEQILSNALKYTMTGSITIHVTQKKILEISDTGIGIAPEDLPRIFEKGFTGYNGRADKKATGLGLYLCRETAKKLSYTIKAESVVGKGTKISIDLNKKELEIE